MRKTVSITKYEIHWQIVRTSIKGNGKEKIKESIDLVFNYFNSKRTQDRWERSVNWIEAIIRGFKSSEDYEVIDFCIEEMDRFGLRDNLPFEDFTVENQLEDIKSYSFEQRYICWKDLFKYEKHFCSRKYRHKELESLVNQMHQVFIELDEVSKIKPNFSYDKILDFRAKYKQGTNKQKFFF